MSLGDEVHRHNPLREDYAAIDRAILDSLWRFPRTLSDYFSFGETGVHARLWCPHLGDWPRLKRARFAHLHAGGWLQVDGDVHAALQQPERADVSLRLSEAGGARWAQWMHVDWRRFWIVQRDCKGHVFYCAHAPFYAHFKAFIETLPGLVIEQEAVQDGVEVLYWKRLSRVHVLKFSLLKLSQRVRLHDHPTLQWHR